MALYVQYGCGLSAPVSWKNYDASPTLRLQKIPIISIAASRKVKFPNNVLFGDIVKGLPGIKPNSCDAIYCSHTLEHLSLNDFYKALKNTYMVLKPGAIFRCVLPDLEFAVKRYLDDIKSEPTASILFMKSTMLGLEQRSVSFKERIIDLFGNSAHLWMWDQYSLAQALNDVGFKVVRKCNFQDSTEKAFLDVEDESRFWGALAFESIK
jgi:ubiquinone/menaquinone biosynthesis C-methylase UbiE